MQNVCSIQQIPASLYSFLCKYSLTEIKPYSCCSQIVSLWGNSVIFSGLFSMLNTGHMHIWSGLCLSFKYYYCQHISSVGLAHYNCRFMKCDTVNSERKVFCMNHEFNWNSGIWRIFFLKGYKHLVVMGLDSRHVILTASPHFSNTPSSGFCGFFLTLRNCQSSQWPGQALSLWRWGFKMVPTKQHGRRIWKRHNELKKKKNPSYLGNKTRGRRENVEEREKGGTLTPLYSPANSESSE